MARGWESKNVEEQIRSQPGEALTTAKRAWSAAEAERRRQREGILLLRARAASELEATRHERRRAILAASIEHLDAQLAALDAEERG